MVNNDFVVSQVSSDQMADEAVVVPVKKVVFDILLLQLGKHVAVFFPCFCCSEKLYCYRLPFYCVICFHFQDAVIAVLTTENYNVPPNLVS